MTRKFPICPDRIRTIPEQFSWVDHRLVRDHHIELLGTWKILNYRLYCFNIAKKEELHMKTSTIVRKGIPEDLVGLVSRLVNLIPWPERRHAMGDVALVLLDGKHRVAEDVFLGGIRCASWHQ